MDTMPANTDFCRHLFGWRIDKKQNERTAAQRTYTSSILENRILWTLIEWRKMSILNESKTMNRLLIQNYSDQIQLGQALLKICLTPNKCLLCYSYFLSLLNVIIYIGRKSVNWWHRSMNCWKVEGVSKIENIKEKLTSEKLTSDLLVVC